MGNIGHRARVLVMAILLGWTALAAGKEAVATFTLHARPPLNFRQPARWLPGTRQVLMLQAFLRNVDRLVPSGEKIAFTAPGDPLGDGLYRYLWASYLLPERDVLPLAAGGVAEVRYLAAFRSRPDDGRRWKVVAHLKEGAVYRRAD
jgi:hypothetical protein